MIRLAILLIAATVGLQAQNVPTEYEVKAAFLYHFTKFVDWPATAPPGAIRICVAGTNPFGPTLDDTLRGEELNGRPMVTIVIQQPDPGCHVLFVPRGVPSADYLRATASKPTLTVGESPAFLKQGGIVNFVIEENRVRFEINPDAATRVNLRISARLLQLARIHPL